MKKIVTLNKVIFCLISVFVITLLSTQQLRAQDTGEITGTISDTAALKGAVVMVQGNSKLGSITDEKGNFTIKNIPSGTYNIVISLFGYNSDTLEDISVEAGKTTTIPPVTMTEEVQEEKTFTIVGVKTKNEGSEKTAVQDTKKSEKIISVLSTEQIQKGQDRDAGEAVRRIPGVSLSEGKFILVRGLAQRYNSVWLNDAGAPSSETDSKAFSFDIIPSQMIDKIQVYKTAAPDLPGDFAGGMVKIYTRASPTKRSLQVNVQGSYRPGSTFGKFNYTGGGGAGDIFGFGGGYRDLPSSFPTENLGKVPAADQSAVDQSLKNTWGLKTRTALPDLRLNIFYTDRARIFKKVEFGNTFNLTYANLNTIYKIHREDWDHTSKLDDFHDVQSTNTVRLGLIENMAFRISPQFKIEFKNLFNQFGIQQNTSRTNNPVTGDQDIRAYMLSYESRTTYSTQLTGDVNSKNEKIGYNWALGYSYINRDLPDLRRLKYTKAQGAADSTYVAQVPPGTADPNNGGGRLYQKLRENVVSLNQNLKINLVDKKPVVASVNVGGYVEYKSRSFSARTIGYVLPPAGTPAQQQAQQALLHLPLDQIFSNSYVGVTNGYKLDEITSLSDAYTAQNFLVAPYISATAKFIDRINVLGGFRYEHNYQAINSYLNTQKLDTSVTTQFLLPSLNVSYNFTKKSQLRAAYGRTLNRPEFREWSPFSFYSFDFNASTYGSLFPTVLSPRGQILKVCTIDNYDLRYEFYPSSEEMITFGAFYKHMLNPIQRVIVNGTADSRAFSFNNADEAYATGLELDIRKSLGFIKRSSSFLKDLDLVANASVIKSQVTNRNVINQDLKTPLQGQSPYVFNAGFYYQSDSTGWQASILYNVFGPRIYLYGTKDYPSYIEMPRNSLDVTLSKKVSKRTTITVGAQNILNQASTIIQDTNHDGKYERPSRKDEDGGPDKLIMSYRQGTYYTVGVKINL